MAEARVTRVKMENELRAVQDASPFHGKNVLTGAVCSGGRPAVTGNNECVDATQGLVHILQLSRWKLTPIKRYVKVRYEHVHDLGVQGSRKF